jgi:Delta7-sterol 5-desaturase
MWDFISGFWANLLATFPQTYVTGLLTTGAASGLAFLVFWKLLAPRLRNWRIQIERRADAKQFKRELWNAIFTLAGGAFLSCFVIYLSTLGYTRLYVDLSDHHPLIAVMGIPLLLLIDDAWFYWVHRALHHPRIYKYVHHEHHRSLDVNPLTTMSFHWLEPILLTIWIVPAAFIFPIYAPILGIVQIYGLLDNIKSHLGYEIYPSWLNRSPLRFLTSSTYHNLHHTKFRGNYGVHFRFWDRLMGTELDQYEPTYAEIQARKSGTTPEGEQGKG